MIYIHSTVVVWCPFSSQWSNHPVQYSITIAGLSGWSAFKAFNWVSGSAWKFAVCKTEISYWTEVLQQIDTGVSVLK